MNALESAQLLDGTLHAGILFVEVKLDHFVAFARADVGNINEGGDVAGWRDFGIGQLRLPYLKVV